MVGRVGRVTYLVDMHDKMKRKRIFHVNMLKSLQVRRPTEQSYWVESVSDSDGDADVPVWNEAPEGEATAGEQLTSAQQKEKSSSEWAAPIVLVKKKDGSLRMCVDYPRLNSVSRVDAYPMPRIDDLIDRLGRAKYITTLDLTREYWHMPVAEKDRDKTAFTTPFGLFQFNVMPFGLNGAPASFQRMMDHDQRSLRFCCSLPR